MVVCGIGNWNNHGFGAFGYVFGWEDGAMNEKVARWKERVVTMKAEISRSDPRFVSDEVREIVEMADELLALMDAEPVAFINKDDLESLMLSHTQTKGVVGYKYVNAVPLYLHATPVEQGVCPPHGPWLDSMEQPASQCQKCGGWFDPETINALDAAPQREQAQKGEADDE